MAELPPEPGACQTLVQKPAPWPRPDEGALDGRCEAERIRGLERPTPRPPFRPAGLRSGRRGGAIQRVWPGHTLAAMHPGLRIYFDHVWPLFWPWLVWNLLRVAAWHERSGREALCAVDCFGNIRFVRISDAPPPDDLYTYEAPRVPRWERPAVCSAVLAPVRVWSVIVGHDPARSGLVMPGHDLVRYDHGLHVRGPP